MAQIDPPDKALVAQLGHLVSQIAAIPPDRVLRNVVSDPDAGPGPEDVK